MTTKPLRGLQGAWQAATGEIKQEYMQRKVEKCIHKASPPLLQFKKNRVFLLALLSLLRSAYS